MGDEPPPLPPKLRSVTGSRYTEQDIAKALEEENKEYERIRREKLGRSQSQRSASLKDDGLQDRPRSQTPTEKGNSRTGEVKPRPRPNSVTNQPVPKPRTISLSQTPPVNLLSQTQTITKPRSVSYSASSIAPEADAAKTSQTALVNESNKSCRDGGGQQDLMSFHSPEKPKNDILELLHNINANQSAVVPVSSSQGTYSMSSTFRQSYNSQQTSQRPSSSLSTYQVFTGSHWSAITQNGTSYPSYSSASTAVPYRPAFSQSQTASSSLSFTNFPSQLVPSSQALSGSQSAPPLPLRCPVMESHRMSALVSQLSVTQSASSSPAESPTTTGTPTLELVRTKASTPKDDDLIDLGRGSLLKDSSDSVATRTSLLDVFDPILLKAKEEEEELRRKSVTSCTSTGVSESISTAGVPISKEAHELLQYKMPKVLGDDEMSYYEQVDPFEYMHPGASSTRSDPVYDIYDGLVSPGAVGGETFDIPPPLPPRTSAREPEAVLRKTVTSPRMQKKHMEKKRSGVVAFDGKSSTKQIFLRKIPALSADDEARAFWDSIKSRRGEYTWNDHIGNPGLLHSACLEGTVDPTLSAKLSVYYRDVQSVTFTCNLDSSVEHVVMHSVCTLELPGEYADYVLKVRGVDDYLSGETILGEYEYVHSCMKYDEDVVFTLMLAESVKQSYLRTEEDDLAVVDVRVEDLMSAGSGEVVHHETLIIVVETFEIELTRLQNSGFLLVDGTPVQDLPTPMRSRRLRQVVKQMCALLGNLETIEVSDAINALVSTCRIIQQSQGILDGEEDISGQRVLSTGSHDTTNPDDLKQLLLESLSQLAAAVNNFLVMYARAFRVDFTVDMTVDPTQEQRDIRDVREKVSIKVQGLHRLQLEWKYDEYFVDAQLFHGSRCIGQSVHTQTKKVLDDPKFYPKVVFHRWLDLGARINTLPRESRLVLTVFGLKVVEAENKVEQTQYIREELGWAAIQCFSFEGHLSQGYHLLTLWPMASDKRLGPAPYSSDHPQVHGCAVLSVELVDFGGEVVFPEVTPQEPKKLEFSSLDSNTQQLLSDIIERDIFTFNKGSVEDREILWEKRHYLHEEPFALAKVLLAAHSWDVSCLADLHSLVKNWASPSPADALHLLLPCFADSVVRARAVEWIRGLGSDELITFLPQLVQAVKHEAWDISPTAELLLERALTSPRLAHHLYWLLNQCLPLQTNMGGEREVVSDARYRRRLNLVTRALMAICGKNIENRLLTQEAVLRSLYATAMNIKDTKDSQRMNLLGRDLKNIHDSLEVSPTSLPLSPSLEVAGVDVKNCSYFNSFTVPLKLAFLSSEKNTDPIHAIFKVGDDLRQDMLVIQMIRLMDKLWLKEGLDLKVVTFSVVPTGDKIGIIELVKEAETLRKIQTEYGVTGSFQDRPIAEWLAKQNPSQLEYQRAVDNFTASCAGYCVATYILGICDRHNDNIMLKTSGHLFHIDFGKFLGDAQKFGSFKRDRTPFVLTSDMAYVINGGEKPSDKFQSFVDLCCRAFNIIRRNGQLLLYLFALMASSGIPGVTWDAVTYVERSLLQDKTNAEAGAMFSRMIQESLKSWFTQVNFFIHNLAQLRFSGDHSDDLLLSFIPRTYTLAQDGKIRMVRLYSYQKRYNPNKYYVYILEVEREGQREPAYLFRSYREFSEFHQKLCLIFPLARIHGLPKGVQIGRSEVKAVAEKRKLEIELFLATLFDLAPEISHSDLVYTFFHPLLRDQEDTDIHIKKLKNKDNRTSHTPAIPCVPGQVQGQVKVSVQYLRGQLQIMVQHARNLSLISTGQEPSPYVKLYLLPDPHKKTKRKTKVVKKTCHPIFMEPITYRMSQDIVKQRVLEISVWSEDKFSENIYLGSSYLRLSALELKEEQSEWLSLEHQRNTAVGHTIQHEA
ncbi:phosphatidylinositol 4-phosphate 3-kinase C2 domain-containing subunit alpha-like isoform X2 [Homarus americanus]|uniref:phosphatidylinositol 4-phosphate 3-kinase C2 domain-containing subunit alpha-like isoform X2 n=1 Tax=Homarus americanus TaxID=6706 RepID=UPI001C492CB4|nr:phosphatidylinositol 4-phosphate 3-kinase C2 domain-containing subunit alpha-like isoform X2 [Homarus americanus]